MSTLLDVPTIAPFVHAPELKELAQQVMTDYDEFRDLRVALEERALTIRYVWETKPFDPAKDELKTHTIAKVTKANDLWACLAETDLALQFREWFWRPLNDRQKEAIVWHELRHIRILTDEGGAFAGIKLREHDVEEFAGVMRHFGAIVPGRRAFVDAYLAWAQENGAEMLVTSPVDEAAAKLASVVGDGIDSMTISTEIADEKRSVTIDKAAADRIRKNARKAKDS